MWKTVGKCVATSFPTLLARRSAQFMPSRLPVQNGVLHLPAQTRFHSSTPIGKIDKPTYQLTFTCKACDHRSSHLMSKQAYHKGTVLIQCPDCKNRHLIADHLNVFGQGKKTLEDILREKGDGETVKQQTVDMPKIDLSKLGDIEWEGPDKKPHQNLIE